MKRKMRMSPSVAWREVRGESRGAEYRAAYAQRRLELEVAAKICALRVRRGLSQEQFAHRLGTKQSAIARLEGAGENLTLARLQRIAALLGAQLKIDLQQRRAS